MISYSLKVMVMLAYFTVGCHLFFVDRGDSAFLYGVLTIVEAIGLIFITFAMMLLFYMGWRR
tara:strand:- start:246 stop:431 length:186 start_codon:yes stop_codon:yes gene_type:complete